MVGWVSTQPTASTSIRLWARRWSSSASRSRGAWRSFWSGKRWGFEVEPGLGEQSACRADDEAVVVGAGGTGGDGERMRDEVEVLAGVGIGNSFLLQRPRRAQRKASHHEMRSWPQMNADASKSGCSKGDGWRGGGAETKDGKCRVDTQVAVWIMCGLPCPHL